MTATDRLPDHRGDGFTVYLDDAREILAGASASQRRLLHHLAVLLCHHLWDRRTWLGWRRPVLRRLWRLAQSPGP